MALLDEPTPAFAAAQHPDAALTEERATPAAAFLLARDAYLAGRRIDMRAIATELGVARTTLYRWTGDRDRLIVDVIWALTDGLIDDLWARTRRRRGRSRLLETIRLYTDVITRSAALRAFLHNETEAALRLLTTRGSLQDRLVARMAELIEEEAGRSGYVPRADPQTLAYGVARVIEGFVYNDAISAVDPQVDAAMEVVGLLL